MNNTLGLWANSLESAIQVGFDSTNLLVLEGTLQRVNYARREFTVVARGRIWAFHLEPDCDLKFDDQPAILRCFHSLDRVRVVYEIKQGELRARAIYSWEKSRMVS